MTSTLFQRIYSTLTNPKKLFRGTCDSLYFGLGVLSATTSLIATIYNFREPSSSTTKETWFISKLSSPFLIFLTATFNCVYFGSRRSATNYSYRQTGREPFWSKENILDWLTLIGSCICYPILPVRNYFLIWDAVYTEDGLTIDGYEEYFTKNCLFLGWHIIRPTDWDPELKKREQVQQQRQQQKEETCSIPINTAKYNKKKTSPSSTTGSDQDDSSLPCYTPRYSIQLMMSCYESSKKWFFDRLSFIERVDNALYDESFCYTLLNTQVVLTIPLLIGHVIVYGTSSSSSSSVRTIQQLAIASSTLLLAVNSFSWVARSFTFRGFLAYGSFAAFDVFATVFCLIAATNSVSDNILSVQATNSTTSLPSLVAAAFSGSFSSSSSLPAPFQFYIAFRLIYYISNFSIFIFTGAFYLYRIYLNISQQTRDHFDYFGAMFMGATLSIAHSFYITFSNLSHLTQFSWNIGEVPEREKLSPTKFHKQQHVHLARHFPLMRLMEEFLFDTDPKLPAKREIIDWQATAECAKRLKEESCSSSSDENINKNNNVLLSRISTVASRCSKSMPKDRVVVSIDHFYNRVKFLLILKRIKKLLHFVHGANRFDENTLCDLIKKGEMNVNDDNGTFNIEEGLDDIGLFDVFLTRLDDFHYYLLSDQGQLPNQLVPVALWFSRISGILATISTFCVLGHSLFSSSSVSHQNQDQVLFNLFMKGSIISLFTTSILLLPTYIRTHLILCVYANCNQRSGLQELAEEIDLYYSLPIDFLKEAIGDSRAIPSSAADSHVLPFLSDKVMDRMTGMDRKEYDTNVRQLV